MPADMKDWIQNRAEELATERCGREFYDLPAYLQDDIYNDATEAYKDYYASLIDYTYECEKYRRLGC